MLEVFYVRAALSNPDTLRGSVEVIVQEQHIEQRQWGWNYFFLLTITGMWDHWKWDLWAESADRTKLDYWAWGIVHFTGTWASLPPGYWTVGCKFLSIQTECLCLKMMLHVSSSDQLLPGYKHNHGDLILFSVKHTIQKIADDYIAF